MSPVAVARAMAAATQYRPPKLVVIVVTAPRIANEMVTMDGTMWPRRHLSGLSPFPKETTRTESARGVTELWEDSPDDRSVGQRVF
jgi:hypothetical protein